MNPKTRTERLLKMCEEVGYVRVCILPKEVLAFYRKKEPRGADAWPALWSIVREIGVKWGCANGFADCHQSQTIADAFEEGEHVLRRTRTKKPRKV